MRKEDRAQLICLVWYEHGVRSGRYLSDIPYHDLTPGHRDQLFNEALTFTKQTPLLPERRRKSRRQHRWVWLERRR